jgi:hypothetical protein
MAKGGKKARRERSELRFIPRPVGKPPVVYAVGAVAALLLGAGAWAQWGRVMLTSGQASLPAGTWILAAGIVALGVAIWLATSGELTLRVGDGGLAVEKNGVTRLPWWGVESIAYDGTAVVARGKGEGGAEVVVQARVKGHPQAAAWIVREARARVPDVVQIGDEAGLPTAREGAGERLVLEQLQIVGRRCVASGTIIAFEPDARVCGRCERVYHKDHVPEACECGGAMNASKGADVSGDADPREPAADAAPHEATA